MSSKCRTNSPNAVIQSGSVGLPEGRGVSRILLDTISSVDGAAAVALAFAKHYVLNSN